jgi:hypothetical protein
MNCEKNGIKALIEKAIRMEIQALKELNNMFYDYALGTYRITIGNTYGNQYFDDYIGKVTDGVLKSIKNFRGSSREAFCVYVNKCITNIAKKFRRDHINHRYKFISLNHTFGVVNVSTHFLRNGNAEDFVVYKMIKNEIIFEHMLPALSAAEKDAILRKMDDVETVQEYAKRVACSENTIRARESKAMKKMKEKAVAKGLKDLYHL